MSNCPAHCSVRTIAAAMALSLAAAYPLVAVAQPSAVMPPPAKAKAAASVSRATPKEARAMLERAVKLLKEKPAAAAFAAFNAQKGEFVRGDLYVFVVDLDGHMHAHGGAPEGLVGMQVLDLRDAAGKSLIREMIDVAKAQGKGVVDYVWLNRVNNRVETKTTFIERVGDNIVGVGYYQPRSSQEQARVFLDQAVAEMQRVGANAAFVSFNDRKSVFVRDDLYVFAIGLDDYRFYAMGATPGLTGSDVRDLRDASGREIVQDMVALVREQGSGEYEYVWRNPANNKVEKKHSFVKKVDGYLVGVGYYSR